MNTRLQTVLSKELSRRDFLKLVAGAILMVVGIQNFMSYLSNFKKSDTPVLSDANAHGFGSRKFGK